jgi:hypothetical protein
VAERDNWLMQRTHNHFFRSFVGTTVKLYFGQYLIT